MAGISADTVVLQQATPSAIVTMSASGEGSPANGHLSPTADGSTIGVANGIASESDLSDVSASRPAQAEPVSPDAADSPATADSPAEKPEVTFEGASEASDSGDDNEGDQDEDADFDMADSPASAQSDADKLDSSAIDARPASKRKAAMEDEFMRENPELYGLRRSVRTQWCGSV